ncbi:uncharacterized protein N7469_011477 [Penicillium citrinum]|uniref:Uncharacterized protein n=2 Tax=Penicillium TaxID=5073 RepID=A0A9W9NDH9_PENCI|nr:uncharacterized protein N7469_011477 [Penicillium citrinum]KAJ5217852.1 hypothetical protein N7469_011477 [Penicillium citrinum]KAJ5575265.1 hypothetical protein N7450_009164 [Penicillium hetheringtonii]KAK5796510.1 hypothetical protein VI817_005795 [Penicillium citrinum]
MDYEHSEHGNSLSEHIGTSIKMLVDGELEDEIDLAVQLAGLRYDEADGMMGHLLKKGREGGFWKWKRETLLRREAHGH